MDDGRVERYLRHIGLTGPVPVTAEGLAALQIAHLERVPFENLDIIHGVGVVLDLDTNFEKIVGRGRGGYCYELNGLFADLLATLGFRTRLLSARVAMDGGRFGPPADHLMLMVELDDAYLVDVGFGDSFTQPLRLSPGVEQPDRGSSFMVLHLEEEWALSRKRMTVWETTLLFSPQPRLLSDFQERCDWTQKSPDSHFIRKPVCTRLTAEGRKTISGARMIVTTGNAKAETEIPTEEAMRGRLLADFGITAP